MRVLSKLIVVTKVINLCYLQVSSELGDEGLDLPPLFFTTALYKFIWQFPNS